MEHKYFCKECAGERNHKEIFSKKISGSDDYGYLRWLNYYKVIECLGCENISFLHIYGDTEMITHDEDGAPDYYFDNNIYPPYLEKGRELEFSYHIPLSIREIYLETIAALKNQSYILTAGGLRAIIEALCNHLKIKKDILSKRIDLLHKEGHLTLSESKRLHSIRFLGNDALHEIEKPKKEQLYLLLSIINHLLSNLFINDKIIKGKIETIVSNYEEFLMLIKSKISENMVGKELTINEIIGKARRAVPKEKFSILEKELIKNIKAGKYEFLELENEKEKESIFKVIQKPSIFDFL